eukprot:5842921-Prymnesium_polylepis.1
MVDGPSMLRCIPCPCGIVGGVVTYPAGWKMEKGNLPRGPGKNLYRLSRHPPDHGALGEP